MHLTPKIKLGDWVYTWFIKFEGTAKYLKYEGTCIMVSEEKLAIVLEDGSVKICYPYSTFLDKLDCIEQINKSKREDIGICEAIEKTEKQIQEIT